MNDLHVLILAAGEGKRMQSSLPKVLHTIANKPLLEHVIDSAEKLNPSDITVIYGNGGDLVKNKLNHKKINWVFQSERLGTGHAVKIALASEYVKSNQNILILYGDVPLITPETLNQLVNQEDNASINLLTARLANPDGLGRIIRDNKNNIIKIIEQKDAKPEELNITEINTGILYTNQSDLKNWLDKLNNNNNQNEYYLTDIIKLAVDANKKVSGKTVENNSEVLGINNPIELSRAERLYQLNQANLLMTQGVNLLDPNRIDVRGNISVGKNIKIDIDVILEGKVVIGDGVSIGPFCYLKDTEIKSNTEIKSHCHIEKTQIGEGCVIGPFARLRPETQLENKSRVGNFVEIKKAKIGEGSKVNHLSYIGDAVVGEKVNIGAGTITCNYDGANKHLTEIENGVFVGSGTQLVAPIKIGQNATIGAGSTIRKPVSADGLTLTKSEQFFIQNWVRPKKEAK